MRTFSEEMHHRMTCENVLRHIDDIPNKWHDAYWDAPCNITWPLVKRSIGEAMPYCVINQSDMRLISNKPSRWRDFPTVCRALSVMRRPSVMWPSTMQCCYWTRHYLLKQWFPPQVNYHHKIHPIILPSTKYRLYPLRTSRCIIVWNTTPPPILLNISWKTAHTNSYLIDICCIM